MNLAEAFIFTTAFAYLGALVLAIQGKPAISQWNANLQKFFYFMMFQIFLLVATGFRNQWVLRLLGAMYGIASFLTFTGIEKWRAYWKPNPDEGSGALQAFMAAWDLACAVCFLMLT